MVASRLDFSASSVAVRSDSRRFSPETWSSEAYTPSRLPNWSSRSAAVFSPMPGTPGMLSDVSPLSPMKSGTSSGPMP